MTNSPAEPRSRRRFLRRLGICLARGAVALVTLAIIGIGIAYPATAAIVCPRCLGFERAAGNIYIERDASTSDRTTVENAVAAGEDRVAAFYGKRRGNPIILACVSEACYRRLGGGGSRGQAYGTMALILSPRGISTVIAAHELSHIELHMRLGLWHTIRHAVPPWFDEGLAVVVSDDRRYLTAPGSPDRCRVADDGSTPPADPDGFYAVAGCRVSRWMAAHGDGAAPVLGLIGKVASGVPFAAAEAAPER
jgi:hypothetical protein